MSQIGCAKEIWLDDYQRAIENGALDAMSALFWRGLIGVFMYASLRREVGTLSTPVLTCGHTVGVIYLVSA